MHDTICCSSHEYEEHDDSIGDSQFHFSNEDESYDTRTRPYMIRWKSGKRVDPRLLTTLESFKEIYDEKRDLFKKIFPGMYVGFADVFKKLGEMVERNKEAASMGQSRTLERSLSCGSPRASSWVGEIGDEFLDERFKVRPPIVIVGGSSGKGGQTSQNNHK